MKSLLSALTGIVLSTSFVAAADLPARNIPVRLDNLPVFTWAGFYMGAQLGIARQRDRLDESPVCKPCALISATGRETGVLGGVHAGGNWAVSAFVIGLEADLELANLDHSTVYPLSAPDSFSSRTRWQGSVRGRLGYAIDRLLIYTTGGVAFADIKHTYNLTPPPAFASESLSNIRTGWTLGGGVEYAFTNSWSARVEYRYTDFGHYTDRPAVFSSTFLERHHETEHTGRVGVSYRF